MKVLCINGSGWDDYDENNTIIGDAEGPNYGDVCTVTNSYYDQGELYYNLLEYYDSATLSGFIAECFIPIQEQETEVEDISINKLENV